jgi:hypothetical protein
MDFDFLTRDLLTRAQSAMGGFRQLVEEAAPNSVDLDPLLATARSFGHTKRLAKEFTVAGVDGSGESPVFQQDDVFMHFVIAAGTLFRTESNRQHKLTTITLENALHRDFVNLRDQVASVREAYGAFLKRLTAKTPKELARESDYVQVFNATSDRRHISEDGVTLSRMAFPKASEIASHAYQIRSLAELGVAYRLLEHCPDYLLIDTSLVYFLLGESIYLPELLKRALVCRANAQGTAVVALCKSHNIPNGDLIARRLREERGLTDHWCLRLPSEALGEERPSWLAEKEVPPKLCVSYLLKFHATDFPMRVDLDADCWRERIGGDTGRERRFFEDLDYTCHDSRSYGYPYPLRAAHRRSALTRTERLALKDVVQRLAARDGLLPNGVVARDPESVHMGGI